MDTGLLLDQYKWIGFDRYGSEVELLLVDDGGFKGKCCGGDKGFDGLLKSW